MTGEFDPRSWAAAQLEVPPSAPLAEVRAALRRRLADDDFVPPLHVHQAAELLLRRGPDGRGNLARCQARLEEEQRLWTEIDDFAGEFFDLPPEKRRQRWQAYFAACAFSPMLVARLRALEPGLNVCVPANLDPDVAELARHVCNLFVLRPAARAAHRYSLLRRMSDAVPRWRTAGRTFWKYVPAVAQLMPDFSKRVAYNLAKLSEEEKRRKHVRGKARIKAAQLAGGDRADSTDSSAAFRGVLLFLIIPALVSVLFQVVGLFHNSPQRSLPKYTPPPSTFSAEKMRWPQSEEEYQRWLRQRPRLEEEIKRLREQLKNPNSKRPQENRLPDQPKPPPP